MSVRLQAFLSLTGSPAGAHSRVSRLLSLLPWARPEVPKGRCRVHPSRGVASCSSSCPGLRPPVPGSLSPHRAPRRCGTLLLGELSSRCIEHVSPWGPFSSGAPCGDTCPGGVSAGLPWAAHQAFLGETREAAAPGRADTGPRPVPIALARAGARRPNLTACRAPCGHCPCEARSSPAKEACGQGASSHFTDEDTEAARSTSACPGFRLGSCLPCAPRGGWVSCWR